MELLNVVTARVIWSFDINELNPTGQKVFPALLDWLKQTYNFEKAPSSVADRDESQGLSFLRGSFQAKEEIFVIVQLKMYRDGFIADTWSSTRDSEAFLGDALKSLSQEFHLAYRPEMVQRRLYLSEVNIRSGINLTALNEKLAELANKVSKLADHEFEFAGVSFWPRHPPARAVASFGIERKLGTDKTENRYFSRAPFHTDLHLGLLEEMEGLFPS